ncbi:hypothetical protein CEXT_89621 [Caerostris extrusa]|uniref:Uncharacterized protein n=1 Tax=Caerostris extrusa TaxID=172846 RepID=A0AAV4PBH1_CAEEX|nr:hypothetical protein CEXT_89621 [Caerostris extrusa]
MVVRRIHLPSVRLGYHPEQEHPSVGGDKTASPSHATDVHGPTGRTNSDHMFVTGRHPRQLRLQLGQKQPHPQPILGTRDGGRLVSCRQSAAHTFRKGLCYVHLYRHQYSWIYEEGLLCYSNISKSTTPRCRDGRWSLRRYKTGRIGIKT